MLSLASASQRPSGVLVHASHWKSIDGGYAMCDPIQSQPYVLANAAVQPGWRQHVHCGTTTSYIELPRNLAVASMT